MKRRVHLHSNAWRVLAALTVAGLFTGEASNQDCETRYITVEGAKEAAIDVRLSAGEVVCSLGTDSSGGARFHKPGSSTILHADSKSLSVSSPSAQVAARAQDVVQAANESAADAAARVDALLAKVTGPGCPTNVNVPLPNLPPLPQATTPNTSPGSTSPTSPGSPPLASGSGATAGTTSPATPPTSGATAAEPGRAPASSTIGGAIPSNANSYPGTFNDGGYVADQLGAAQTIATSAASQEMVDNTRALASRIQQNAADDQRTLSDSYKNLNATEFGQALSRAKQGASKIRDTLGAAISGLDPSERSRFELTARNAVDKVDAALELLKGTDSSDSFSQSPFGALMSGKAGAGEPNPLARTEALSDLFGPSLPNAKAATADALVDRMIMLAGLSDDQKAQVLSKLKLLETPTLTLPTGAQVKIEIPHNGYWLGGGKTGIDCSSLISSALPADIRKGAFTSLDFLAMWKLRRTGKMPLPPLYEPSRAKLVRDTAGAFDAVDLYRGQSLAAGDLLIYRFVDDPIGHVMLVTGYNPVTGKVQALDASQSRGGVGDREFSLRSNPDNPQSRSLKLGFYGLRLKPTETRACKTTGRIPAASRGKGAS